MNLKKEKNNCNSETMEQVSRYVAQGYHQRGCYRSYLFESRGLVTYVDQVPQVHGIRKNLGPYVSNGTRKCFKYFLFLEKREKFFSSGTLRLKFLTRPQKSSVFSHISTYDLRFFMTYLPSWNSSLKRCFCIKKILDYEHDQNKAMHILFHSYRNSHKIVNLVSFDEVSSYTIFS